MKYLIRKALSVRKVKLFTILLNSLYKLIIFKVFSKGIYRTLRDLFIAQIKNECSSFKLKPAIKFFLNFIGLIIRRGQIIYT